MVMNARSYILANPSQTVEKFEDLDDAVTGLADLFFSAKHERKENHLDRISKNFLPKDSDTRNAHKAATPILIGLNSGVEEIIALWPEPNVQKRMLDIYEQKRRGRQLPNSPLNELNTRLTNLQRLIEFLKSTYPIAIRRTFYYSNHKLYIDQLGSVPFRAHTDADIVLSILFQNKNKTWKYLALEKKLIANRPTPKTKNRATSLAKPLKNTCEYINSQIGKYYNEYEDQKVIIHKDGTVRVDSSLFHVTDRINKK